MKWTVAAAVMLALNMPLARRIVVRDMGNGVDRVESHELIIGLDAAKHCQHPGYVPLHHPLPRRVDDLIGAAVGPDQARTYAREIDAQTIEIVVVWA